MALVVTLQSDGSKGTLDTSTLAAPSIVATRIRRSTNQSIPTGTGWTDISLDVANYQTGATFWTSGATVTIPETGLYFVTTEATFDGAGLLAIATISMQVEAVVSGVTTIIGDDEKQLAINSKGSLFVFAQRYFTVGDTIKNQVKHSDAGSLTVLSQATHSPDIIITKVNGAKGETGASGTPTLTEFEIDFGNLPVTNKTFTITNVAILNTNKIIVTPSPNTATGQQGNDWEVDSATFTAKANNGSITLYVNSPFVISGKRKLYYQILN